MDDDQIFVARQERERDPEEEAEFDREFERMMAESLESRKFERKTVFDVPLPARKAQPPPPAPPAVMAAVPAVAKENPQQQTSTNTMAFSLMTRKGNKQQV